MVETIRFTPLPQVTAIKRGSTNATHGQHLERTLIVMAVLR
jgi:hypothetical protein